MPIWVCDLPGIMGMIKADNANIVHVNAMRNAATNAILQPDVQRQRLPHVHDPDKCNLVWPV